MADTQNISILPLNPAAATVPLFPVPQLLPGEAHVWTTHLDLPEDLTSDYAELLAPDESARAARFYFERHQNRFVVGRGVLRSLLGAYLQQPPESLRFDYGPQGKPELSGAQHAANLSFNLAHSEDVAVIALTHAGAVGLDIERVRHLPEFDELVKRFFSPRESQLFSQLRQSEKPQAFFNLWTRKEAWLKATGDGIGCLLHEVDVTFLQEEPAKLLGLPPISHWRGSSSGISHCVTLDHWSLCDLHPVPGYVGALAVAFPDIKIRTYTWEHNEHHGLEHHQEVA